MTERELSEGLGVNQQTVNKCIHEGMPIDSIEAARTWRQANRNISRVTHPPTFSEVIETPDVVVPEDDDAYATVERLSLAERQIAGAIEAWSGMMMRVIDARNAAKSSKAINDAEKRLSQVHLKVDALRKEQRLAIKSLQDAQVKVLKMERERGKLITIDAAKDYITKILSTVLIAIRKLPDISQNEEERVRFITVAEGLLTVVRGAAEEALKKTES